MLLLPYACHAVLAHARPLGLPLLADFDSEGL